MILQRTTYVDGTLLEAQVNDCYFDIALSGNPMPDGFVLDNMGFLP